MYLNCHIAYITETMNGQINFPLAYNLTFAYWGN